VTEKLKLDIDLVKTAAFPQDSTAGFSWGRKRSAFRKNGNYMRISSMRMHRFPSLFRSEEIY